MVETDNVRPVWLSELILIFSFHHGVLFYLYLFEFYYRVLLNLKSCKNYCLVQLVGLTCFGSQNSIEDLRGKNFNPKTFTHPIDFHDFRIHVRALWGSCGLTNRKDTFVLRFFNFQGEVLQMLGGQRPRGGRREAAGKSRAECLGTPPSAKATS